MTRSSVSRRRFLLGAGAVVTGALAAEGLWLEPRRLGVSRIRVGAAGDGAPPIRIAFLADLHLGAMGDFEAEVARAVAAEAPDVVVLGGDVVDDPEGLDGAAAFLRALPGDVPVFATLGNWEYWSDVPIPTLRRMYAESGATLLVNDAVALRDDARLVGVDDLVAGAPSLPTPLAGDLRDHLIVSHCPAWRDEVGVPRGLRVAAMVSGHTHGGQVAVDGWSPFCPPGSGPYVAGWYRDDDERPDLYVSRGLGTSVVPVRLGSEPELVLVDWHPEPR
ncbi:MAG: metallophosphoesterase [Longimicrobiales bacterium]